METTKSPSDPTIQPFAATVDYSRTTTQAELMATPIATLPPASGRFVPLRAHAKGGLGEVFVARDEELGREVALKAIQPEYADDPANRLRFVREAEITGNLEHPGIVPVYGLSRSTDGRPFYAMRFVRGESLETAIARFHAAEGAAGTRLERTVAFLQLLGHFKDACHAIDFAHSRGVIHRDLKPSNIMLGAHGETLVVDWGLAKVVTQPPDAHGASEPGPSAISLTASDQTLPGAAVGTPAFMSPEQAAGQVEKIGPASDIYNLGATFYSLLTSRPPFENLPVGLLLAKAQHGDFLPPRAVSRRPIPPALEAVCLKAMALRPEDRYDSASEFAGEIDHWIADEPLVAYRERASERLSRWSRRHWAWVRVGVAVLVALLFVLAMATSVVHRAWRREQSSRFEAERLAASLDLDQAITLCELDATSRGMLRLVHTLTIAPPAADDLRKTILANLAAWSAPFGTLRQVFPQRGRVRDVDFSADGSALITGSDVIESGRLGGEARVWDAISGKPLGPALRHRGPVTRVAFHPDGKRVLTASTDGTARLWNAADGTPAAPAMEHAAPVSTAALSPDGSIVLTSSGRVVQLWDLASGRVRGRLPIHPSAVEALAFRPAGRIFATGCEKGEICLWDVASCQSVGPSMIERSTLRCMAFSPDGRTLASGSQNGVVRFWETATQQRLLFRLTHHAEILGLVFSPDGKALASCSEDNTAQVWDAATGAPIGLPIEHLGTINSIRFSPDGQTLLTAGGDGTARLWETPRDRQRRARFDVGAPVHALAASANQDCCAAAAGPRLHLWRNGARAAAASVLAHDAEVRSAAVNPEGDLIVTGTADGVAQLWNAKTHERLGIPLNVPGAVAAVVFLPGSRCFLAGGDDALVHAWDPFSGRDLWPPLRLIGGVVALAVDGNGRTIVAADSRAVQRWEIAEPGTVPKRRDPILEHEGPITCVAISRDGEWVASGSEDNTVRFWEARSGRLFGTPLEHHASLITLAFAPDGATLLTGSSDRTARLWSRATCRPIGPRLRHEGHVSAVAFSADGRTLLTGSTDHTVCLWNMSRPLDDNPPRIRSWVEGLTGMILRTNVNPSGVIENLSPSLWRKHHRAEP